METKLQKADMLVFDRYLCELEYNVKKVLPENAFAVLEETRIFVKGPTLKECHIQFEKLLKEAKTKQ